ncbi:MAG: tetraacyldisaccharide 4'-kinase [Cytophagales bacterium]|nr:tetraacyldisaccharide 4'-kinase [Cytophagales bacterium]
MPVLRILLFPFAMLYKLVTDLRNHLYDIGNKKSVTFNRFVISVGNLTAGGTGKTPFAELLIRELKQDHRLAVLSRGYKRKTRGFRMAADSDDAKSIGDEPFQFFTKYGHKIRVAVGEDRALAIPELLYNDDSIEVIILDDAYQHRSVTPQLNILLSDYSRPFYNDFVLPAGMLRESRKHACRADLVVVTKCPAELTETDMEEVKSDIHRYARTNTSVYFAGIRYLEPELACGNERFSKDVFLFSGIANPGSFEQYVDQNFNLLGHRKFPDHHAYSKKDLQMLIENFESIRSDNKCLLTTEKDIVRIKSMKEEARFLMSYPVFYLPIELYFLRNGDSFARELKEKVKVRPEHIKLN